MRRAPVFRPVNCIQHPVTRMSPQTHHLSIQGLLITSTQWQDLIVFYSFSFYFSPPATDSPSSEPSQPISMARWRNVFLLAKMWGGKWLRDEWVSRIFWKLFNYALKCHPEKTRWRQNRKSLQSCDKFLQNVSWPMADVPHREMDSQAAGTIPCLLMKLYINAQWKSQKMYMLWLILLLVSFKLYFCFVCLNSWFLMRDRPMLLFSHN